MTAQPRRAAQRLSVMRPKLWSVGVNTVGPLHDGSGITIGTLEVERARAEIPKRYGTEIPITIEEQAPPVPLVGQAPVYSAGPKRAAGAPVR
jgi:hypothetical protein